MTAYNDLYELATRLLEQKLSIHEQNDIEAHLQKAFNAHSFDAGTVQNLCDYASVTLREDFQRAVTADGVVNINQLVQSFMHSFYDGVVKSSVALNFANQSYFRNDKQPEPIEKLSRDDKDVFYGQAFVFWHVLSDIVHNYNNLAPANDENPLYRDIINDYTAAMDVASVALSNLPKELGLSDSKVEALKNQHRKSYLTGLEHLAKVPVAQLGL